MDVREKLVELLDEAEEWADHKCDELDCEICYAGKMKGNCVQKLMVDRLIANGVTVQEWISVKDRFPEENTTVIASTDNGIVFQCLYAYDGWDLWEGNEVNITHWQPLPQPPKGE